MQVVTSIEYQQAVEVFGPCERPRVAVGALVSFTAQEWAHETVPSLHVHRRGIEVDAAGGCMYRRSGRLPLVLFGVVLGQGPIRCEATVSLVGVVQRRLAKQERHQALRRSSWTLRPDAVINFSASGKCVLVSPRVKATVRVPSPSVDGLRPRLRRGRLVLAFLVSCGVKRAGHFVPASGPSAAAALPDCPALQRQQGGCNGEDEDGVAARTRSFCKVTLKQYLMPIGAAD